MQQDPSSIEPARAFFGIPSHYLTAIAPGLFPSHLLVFYYYNGGDVSTATATCFCDQNTTPCSCDMPEGRFEFRVRIVHKKRMLLKYDCVVEMQEQPLHPNSVSSPRLLAAKQIENEMCASEQWYTYWPVDSVTLPEIIMRFVKSICPTANGVDWICQTGFSWL